MIDEYQEIGSQGYSVMEFCPNTTQPGELAACQIKFGCTYSGYCFISAVVSCNLPTTEMGDPAVQIPRSGDTAPEENDFFSFLPTQREIGSAIPSPTPNPSRELAPLRLEQSSYTVQINDTLGKIAIQFAVTLEALIEANHITDPNILDVGQVLVIPAPIPGDPAPDLKLIPDSELVNGPYNAAFDLHTFIQDQGGQLAVHQEEVDDVILTGAQIVERVATDYSVNPRLLLALLDYQTGWLSHSQLSPEAFSYPMGNPEPSRDSLYLQLTWTADTLNAGYYSWRVRCPGLLPYSGRCADPCKHPGQCGKCCPAVPFCSTAGGIQLARSHLRQWVHSNLPLAVRLCF